jgi:Xaa-Pro aminopeptidase
MSGTHASGGPLQPSDLAEELSGRAGEHRARLQRLQSLLDRRGDHVVLLTARRNFSWLTAGGTAHVLQSHETGVAGLLVTRDDVVLITQNIEAARLADEELSGLGIEVIAVPWWEPGAIEEEANRRLARGSVLKRDEDLESELVSLRSLLSPFDQQRMSGLARTARDAVEATLAAAMPGMSENDIVADLLGRLPGVRAPVILAAGDERVARYRHPLPGTTSIRGRVMLVLVAERWGLHAALTRIRELEPPDADLAQRIAAVGEVRAAMHAATRPGSTLGQVFDAARAAYAATGYADEWRDHHQGGVIGYQAREHIAAPGDATLIETGMAFAWNPSIAGAKAEDTLLLDAEGARVLTA